MRTEQDNLSMRPLVKPDAVCTMLGISRIQLRIMINRGELRPVRIGKKLIRFTEAEIERYVKEAQVAPQ